MQPFPRTAAPPLILVVDDEPMMRRLVRRLLPPWCAMLESDSVDGAIRHLVGSPVAGVISDVHMPGGNAVELFEWMRERRPALAARVVFMSGDAGSSEAQALIDRGCAVIAKACGRELCEAILAAVPPDDEGLDARASGVVCIDRDAEHDVDR